jgi:hypothetical protein
MLDLIKKRINTLTSGLPVPAKGVWFWAVVLVLNVMADFQEMDYLERKEVLLSDSAEPNLILIVVIEALVMLAICLWWYLRSLLHGRRALVVQLFGFLLFAIGTIKIRSSLAICLFSRSLHAVDKLFLGAVLLAGAYFLVFRKAIVQSSDNSTTTTE